MLLEEQDALPTKLREEARNRQTAHARPDDHHIVMTAFSRSARSHQRTSA
jgi:hypothetical protein